MCFPTDFWVFGICFIYIFDKVITYLKFDKRCFIKGNLRKHICVTGWCHNSDNTAPNTKRNILQTFCKNNLHSIHVEILYEL